MNINSHISSRQNTFIKQTIKIINNKNKQNLEKYAILEGIHLCQEWLKNKGNLHKAFFGVNALQQSDELKNIYNFINQTACYTVDDTLLKDISPVVAAQGVFFVIDIPTTTLPIAINRNSIILDRVQDPGNVGTIIRTAAGAGVKDIYLLTGCANPWSSKVLRSTQGAIFSTNIYNNCNVEQVLDILKIPLIITELNQQAKNLYDFQIPKSVVWAFGNEGRGVDKKLLTNAKHSVYIPQEPNVESLNVAIAAAICLFEQHRQNYLDKSAI